MSESQQVFPGDAIVYHGMVGGARGVCLVISVSYQTKDWPLIVCIENGRLIERRLPVSESNWWERISERQ